MSAPSPARTAVSVATVWTGPEAPRDVDEPATRDVPDPAGWAADLDTPLREDLGGRTLTQLLLGDPVQVLETQGPWARVVAPEQASALDARGYPGWVRRAHLVADDDSAGRQPRAHARVAATTATCSTPSGSLALSAGTLLPVLATDGAGVRVQLPDGTTGGLRLDDVRLEPPSSAAVAQDALAQDALGFAARFTGLPYLWGGTSVWGLDCSGLVHLSFRVFDVLLPRDAVDQWTAPMVDRVDLDDVRPGDLYFFARPGRPIHHVGFVSREVADDGRRSMLHAPGWDNGGHIVEQDLDAELLAMLVGAARVRC